MFSPAAPPALQGFTRTPQINNLLKGRVVVKASSLYGLDKDGSAIRFYFVKGFHSFIQKTPDYKPFPFRGQAMSSDEFRLS